MVIRLAAAPGMARIVLHLDPTLEPEAVCWALRHVLVDSATALDAVHIAATVTVIDAATWFADATVVAGAAPDVITARRTDAVLGRLAPIGDHFVITY